MSDVSGSAEGADPPDRWPFLAGAATSLAAVVGYVVVPVAVGLSSDPLQATLDTAFEFASVPVTTHLALLVAPPLLVVASALVAARRRGYHRRTTARRVGVGAVVGPLLTLWAAMVMAAIGVGVTFSSGGMALHAEVLLAVAFTVWALLFGLLFATIMTPVLVVAETAGALAGYLLVVGAERLAGSGTR